MKTETTSLKTNAGTAHPAEKPASPVYRSIPPAPAAMRLEQRSAGVLMHLTSLPGPHGSGDLGPEAIAFADFLQSAGQRWWQMLPVTPPGAGPGYSPYSSDSAFAGNPWLISLRGLVEQGFLTPWEIDPGSDGARGTGDESQADFDASIAFRESRLRLAHERFSRRKQAAHRQFEEFCRREDDWLADYSLFSALKKVTGGLEWTAWAPELRFRNPDALREARSQLAAEIEFHQFVQYQFDLQWQEFKTRCMDRGIGLIGDVPIFVAHDSADVWAHRRLFSLDSSGHPNYVSGYPPDIFNENGQKWGHPHFNWDQHKADNYRWWIARFQSMNRKFDAIRLDHFPGFDQCWAIPPESPTALTGRWIPGGGEDFFKALRTELGQSAQIIAEDIGDLTAAAIALRERFALPGMRILQFAFDENNYHRPYMYPRQCVAYTGTHDNDTVVGWFDKLRARAACDPAAKKELARATRYLGLRDDHEIHIAMIRALYGSPADTVIIPMQDLLGLDTRSRMNIPGTCDGNWRWRLRDNMMSGELAGQLCELVQIFGRGRKKPRAQ